MIRMLGQAGFRKYGTLLSGKTKQKQRSNYHSLPLPAGTTSIYQTTAELWLNFEKGFNVLSLSEDGVTYEDYYLDQAVMLRAGIWFALTPYQNNAAVQIAGSSMPRLVETKAADDSFVVRPQLQVTKLCTFFYQEKEEGFLFPGESHGLMELQYVDQGSLHSVVDGKDLLMEQGQLRLIAPEQWHMCYADIGVAPRCIIISFEATGFDISEMKDRLLQPSQKAIKLLQLMLEEQERMEPGAHDMILSLLTQLLILLQRSTGQSEKKLQSSYNVNNENDMVRRAQQYIEANVGEKLSVPGVAAKVGISASYLTALFHQQLQISPGEYIRRVKLQKGKQLIREGNMNLSQIAAALCYSNIHHFSRQFKEKFGITPTQYARSVR